MKPKISLSTDKHAWSPSPLVGQIVLVTTLNEDGQSNIAPKSWISMMAFEPPLLALGCSLNHVTAQNILRSQEFVVNIPGAEMADLVWRISTVPHPRPVEKVGLTPIPAQQVRPPLIEECKAHLECVLVQHLEFGSEVILLGKILASSIDQAAFDCPDPYDYLKMTVFLENGKYGVIENSQRIGRKEPPQSNGNGDQPVNTTKPTIRPLTAADCEPISAAFTAQGWHKPAEQYQRYYQETLDGTRECLVAEANNQFAGYLNILWTSDYAPFAQAGIPEIADFNVLQKYQRRSIGTALMDAAEQRIAERSAVAGIGVGLLPDYGAAQVLYVRRGYVPDGRGVTSHGKYITYGETVPVDDDLVLYFTKQLR